MKEERSKKSKLVFILILLVSILLVSTIKKALTPFIMAAIFSFILSPIISLLTHKFKLNRTFSVILTYSVFLIILAFFVLNLGSLLIKESRELSTEVRQLRRIANFDTGDYPDWAKIIIFDTISQFDINHIFEPARIMPYFTGVVSFATSVFVMIAATFYFLRDGEIIITKFLKSFSSNSKTKTGEILEKISLVLNNFLLGQLFLVLLMATVSWLSLIILGVKFALILGIFTGIAEIIPIIGPITAGAVAVSVAVFDGMPMFNFSPIFQGLIVAVIYFVLRELEDVFVIPFVFGKTTKLHPAAILFAVILGGHVMGVLGMVIAVPVLALVKILFEYI